MADVSIQEAVSMKRQLERSITSMIAKEVATFQRATGLAVRDMRVELDEVTSHSSRGAEFQIGHFHVEVSL